MDHAHIDSSIKLQRLLQYCTGKARNAIQCCAVMGPDEGYAKACRILKVRFGNDFFIT